MRGTSIVLHVPRYSANPADKRFISCLGHVELNYDMIHLL
jgi:hypothetical protein